MELLDGGNLFDRVSKRNSTNQPTSELDLAVSFRSAMQALLSVHQSGYLHRDIKLDNLVYVSTREGSPVKLIDFGYMCELPSVNAVIHDHLLGTEGCFAPESIMRMEYSAKSDVWQAGCVLYTLLAGHPVSNDTKLLSYKCQY
jgi:serine/threonine protein kinase